MYAVHYIEYASRGCGDAAIFHIRWNGTRMMVDLDQNPLPQATENIPIERYTDAYSSGDEDLVDDIQDEILDVIVKAGASIFDQLASLEEDLASDLHTALFPPQYSFRLVTVGGTLQLLVEETYRLTPYNSSQPGYEKMLITSSWKTLEPDTRCASVRA